MARYAYAGAELVHTKGKCGASTRAMAPDVLMLLSLAMALSLGMRLPVVLIMVSVSGHQRNATLENGRK